MPEVVQWHPDPRGAEALQLLERQIAGLGEHLGEQSAQLLSRHGYRVGRDGDGPQGNVLGHPLFELPIWLASGDEGVDEGSLLEVCEASLCGYLSVRCDDDYFDGAWADAGAAMILSGFFRARHQALLAPLVSDRRFWARFERVWRDYGEAMLLERSLHHPASGYGRAEFDLVLRRSQPLEIPGAAVLAMTGRWEEADLFGRLVGHLSTATQLFDDFVDAPTDLDDGNFTWMVRRLGGLQGMMALRRGMITTWDEVVAEIDHEMEAALRLGDAIGLESLHQWASARRQRIDQASQRMYRALFRDGDAGDPAVGIR